jgi:hypothetical protein
VLVAKFVDPIYLGACSVMFLAGETIVWLTTLPGEMIEEVTLVGE